MAERTRWFLDTEFLEDGRTIELIRNQQMVELGADVCVGFRLKDASNHGTTDCYTKAIRAGIPTLVVTGRKR